MIKAVVFDMDGVIFDSEKKVVECWQVLADKYGFTGIEQACRACLGTTKEKSKEIMLQRYGKTSLMKPIPQRLPNSFMSGMMAGDCRKRPA